jgi:hypothetical protein
MKLLEDFLNEHTPVYELGATAEQWQTVAFRFGTFVMVVQAMRVNDHLCLDVLSFVDGQPARSSVFGMDNGRRFAGFSGDAPGRSQGMPATALVAVLLGRQHQWREVEQDG